LKKYHFGKQRDYPAFLRFLTKKSFSLVSKSNFDFLSFSLISEVESFLILLRFISYKKQFKIENNIKFGHSKFFKLPNNILLVGSYHPSPRNVNTGRIDVNKMTNLFLKVKKII